MTADTRYRTRLGGLVTLVALCIPLSAHAAVHFTVTDIVGDTGSSVAVVIGDVNNDCALDVYVANEIDEQNKL